MSLVLSAKGIAVERGGRVLLSALSFSVPAGGALAITGPNGAGKSTLLRVVAGLTAPVAGRVALEPPDPGDADAPLAERAHYLGHGDALKGALTPFENLRFAAALAGRKRMAPVEALGRLNLSHVADLPCAYLSAGQRRRVALARLLVAFRPLWLLDEPTTALDQASEGAFAAVMRDHLSAGGLILAATHAPLGLSGTRELRLGAA